MQDLPVALLSQILALVRDSRRSLFRSCRLLRDLTFSSANDIQCLLQPSSVTPAQAAQSLQLLASCKPGAKVKLVLEDPDARPEHPEEQQTATFSTWLTLCTDHGSVLVPVTHVELKAHTYGGLIPAGIQACCPNMTHFSHWGWFQNAPGTEHMDASPCPQLQHLTINHLLLSYKEESNMPVEQLQLQFSVLPNLQSLECLFGTDPGIDVKWDGPIYTQTEVYFAKAIQPLSSHLEALTLPSWKILCAYPWAQLQSLVMPQATVDDSDVDSLLRNMPQIKELEVWGFEVEESFTSRECKWQHLTAEFLDCMALARLPMASISSLRFDALSLYEELWPHMQSITTALSRINHVGCRNPAPGTVIGIGAFSHLGFPIPDNQVPQLVALLRALRQDHVSIWRGIILDDDWLQVLAGLPCRTLSITVCLLSYSEHNCWGRLLQELPQLQVLHLSDTYYAGMPEVTAMWLAGLSVFCASATRPCKLQLDRDLAGRLDRDLGPGWQAQLQSSMQAAGHQHVSIQVLD